jgi:hypothetical protein
METSRPEGERGLGRVQLVTRLCSLPEALPFGRIPGILFALPGKISTSEVNLFKAGITGNIPTIILRICAGTLHSLPASSGSSKGKGSGLE